MRLVLAVVVLGMACAAPKAGSTATASTSGPCMWKPIPKAEYLVRYFVNPNYTPKDRGEAVALVREGFQLKVEQTLAGSGVTLVEAQGQPHYIAVNIALLNDGNDNLNLSVNAGVTDNAWGRVLHWSSTYTDPQKMVDDYATDFARSLIDPPRPCPY